MRSKNREVVLKIAAGGVAALFLLDRFVFSPAIHYWADQGEQIAALRAKVQRGRDLLSRERSIRVRWDDMLHSDLPEDVSAAEGEVIKGMDRWAIDSGLNFTSLLPVWKVHPEGYDTNEYTATTTGDQASLGHLIYALEVDPLPARLEDCELSARDAKGQQLNLTLKFSFIHFTTVAAAFR